MKRRRVGIVGLLQESNTFVASTTTLEHFRDDLLLEGAAVRDRMIDAPHEVGGFFEGLESAGIEAVPIFLARAVPYGVIEAGTFDELVRRMLDGLDRAGHLDGLLAAPHGATVAENAPDADGFWLEEVRNVIGPDLPYIATIDPHANLSQRMVDATDALIAYETNPHLDQRETGLRAASLMVRTLSGEIKPTQAAAFPPVAINIQSQNTGEQPLKDLYSWVRTAIDDVLSVSIVLGFPYADVPEMGSSVVVVTGDDRDRARHLSTRVGNQIYERRNRFEPRFTSPLKAVENVLGTSSTPVVLLDMGDNVGGGSPANGTALLHEIRLHAAGPAFACLADAPGAAKAFDVGIGGRIEDFAIGDPINPFMADFDVLSLHDGRFSERESRHGGYSAFDQGRTAVLGASDRSLTVMLTSKRVPPFSLRQMTAFGLDPASFRLIVAKGVIAPQAAFAPIAKGGFIHVDTPGPTRADMTKLIYRHRRKPMFPFEKNFG